MSRYLIQFGNEKHSREWLSTNPDQSQKILEKTRLNNLYPLCLCKSPPPQLYIGKKKQFYLARMPNDGPSHALTCDFYEPDYELNARKQLSKNAISELPGGKVSVRIHAPLNIHKRDTSKRPPRNKSSNAIINEISKQDRLELIALLHLIWDKSQFNRWYPKMAGHRGYTQMYKFIKQACDNILLGKHPLTEHLYIPEPFKKDDVDNIKERANAQLSALLQTHDGEPKRAYVIGLAKRFLSSKFGGKGVQLAHAPKDIIFWMNEKEANLFEVQFNPGYAHPSDNESRIAVIMNIEKTKTGNYHIHQIAGMPMINEFIPATTFCEYLLAKTLISKNRSFIKPLSYNHTDVASFLLLDNNPEHPTPLEILGTNQCKYDEEIKHRLNRYSALNMPYWLWDSKLNHEDVPELPPQINLST